MKKRLWVVIVLSAFWGLVAGATTPAAEAPPNVEEQFTAAYAKWRARVDAERYSSNPGTDVLLEMVKLGLPALPLLIAKMEERPDRAPLDFLLQVPVTRILKLRFSQEDYPGQELADSISGARRLTQWWRERRKETPARFEALYRGWQEDTRAGRAKDAQDKLTRMKNLGVAALPCMVEKVGAGEAGLIPAISYLTDGAVSASATPAQCADWWANNKEKWSLPPLESTAVDAPAK